MITEIMHHTNTDVFYDVIIGLDIIYILGLAVDGTNKNIKWDSDSILRRNRDSTVKGSFYIEDPKLIRQESERKN